MNEYLIDKVFDTVIALTEMKLKVCENLDIVNFASELADKLINIALPQPVVETITGTCKIKLNHELADEITENLGLGQVFIKDEVKKSIFHVLKKYTVTEAF